MGTLVAAVIVMGAGLVCLWLAVQVLALLAEILAPILGVAVFLIAGGALLLALAAH
jgi:hypothetical protein